LFNFLYSHRSDGGPIPKVLDVVIFRINEEIKREGYHLHSHMKTVYYESVDAPSHSMTEAKIPTGQKQKADKDRKRHDRPCRDGQRFFQTRCFAKDEDARAYAQSK